MAFTREIVALGTSPAQAAVICGSTTTGATAAGTTQADAYKICCSIVEFTTVGASTGAVIPSGLSIGDDLFIYNAGANTLTVYPPGSDTINNGATSLSVAANKGVIIWQRSAGKWASVLTA